MTDRPDPSAAHATATADPFVATVPLAELAADGARRVVQAAGRTLLLVQHEDRVHAIDNRCPHMGFPLERGDVSRGVLTCPWHHARFELCSGGTFDPFADDARAFAVEIRPDPDGSERVWVDPRPARDERAYARRRLRQGLEQRLSLVLAKSVLTLDAEGEDPAAALAIAGSFGASQRGAGWRSGLTILTAMANLLPDLDSEARPLALYHGLRHVADDVAGQAPRRPLEPLGLADPPAASRLGAWLREFAAVRDRAGCERVLLTAIEGGCSDAELASLLHAAATDHLFLDGGHTVDFVNKACELLDRVGWRHAAEILPSVLPGIAFGERMEESPAWRNPVDLPRLLAPTLARLAASGALAGGSERLEDDAFDALVDTLLDDDPAAIRDALEGALAAGAAVTEVSLALCVAAASRVARFHTSNEFGDWIAVLHTLSAAHASHRLLQRAPDALGARGIWHVAMDLWLRRFLNAPAARPPGEAELAELPDDATALEARLLELTDRRGSTEAAAAVVARHLAAGHPPEGLIRTLASTLLREDGEFHSYQMLEAGVRLYHELAQTRPQHAEVALTAVARYLAAHAPTDRATTQTWHIAQRLQRGGSVGDA